jgi:hypothetical protein
MTNLCIIIIDTHHENKEVDIEDITKTGAEMLISECERLLSKLKDKFYEDD